MKFEIDDLLPLVSVEIEYIGKKKAFSNVLLDTGCSSTILDTDLCEEIGLMLDLENAITRKMYRNLFRTESEWLGNRSNPT